MGEISLPQEILEHVLKYADGETLLTCREVSPKFKAAVQFLSKTTDIWEKCYAKERGDHYPFTVISKVHPHNEGFGHPKNWARIYESSMLRNLITSQTQFYLEEMKLCKEYSNILDMETHEDLILVLVKYNKDFSIYYRIITINLENVIVDKSFRFYASMLYITPVEDPSVVKSNAIQLYCDLCQLVAVPIYADTSVVGFPKFSKNDNFLTVEHSKGETLWINSFGKLITKGKCFHTGTAAKHEEIKSKDLKSFKVYQGFITLFISCGETKREFNTFKELRANVTASLVYSDVLIIGTETGMLYAYTLGSELALKKLNLKCFIWRFSVCSSPILVINVMELKNVFVVVCCSKKSVYHIRANRKFQKFN